MSWRTTAYRAVRPLLFLTDPERDPSRDARRARLRPGDTPPAARSARSPPGSRAAGEPGRAHGPALPQPRRPRRGLRQGRPRHRGLGGARLRLRRARHRHAAAAGRAIRARACIRLPRDRALINRMGFNNAGADALAGRIADARPRLPEGFVDRRQHRPQPRRRRRRLLRPRRARWPSVADYLAINVSSPEHARPARPRGPGAAARAARHGPRGRAVARRCVVKLSPDLTHNRRAEIVRRAAPSRRAA